MRLPLRSATGVSTHDKICNTFQEFLYFIVTCRPRKSPYSNYVPFFKIVSHILQTEFSNLDLDSIHMVQESQSSNNIRFYKLLSTHIKHTIPWNVGNLVFGLIRHLYGPYLRKLQNHKRRCTNNKYGVPGTCVEFGLFANWESSTHCMGKSCGIVAVTTPDNHFY